MICKTCRYWVQAINEARIKRDGAYTGQCNNPHFIYTGDGSKIGDDELGYWDTDSYNAGFITGKNFGCIHHSI